MMRSYFACLLIVAAALTGCIPADNRQTVDFMIPVSLDEVRLGSIEERIVTTGTLRAPEVVTLSVETAGILEIGRGRGGHRFAEGDRVKAGDVIARIVGEDVRLAARRAANQQRHDAALHDLEAARALFQRRLINQTEVDRVAAAYHDAKLALERSLLTEERNRLTTPIDGVILSLGRTSDGQRMANGQLVGLGQAVAQVAPLDVLIADIDLVGKDLARVRVGSAAKVNYHAWEQRYFPGELRRLAPIIDPKTRALKAEVAVKNSEELLRPGMFVEVSLIVERRENVPVVPRRAISVRGGKSVVFVHVGERVAQRELDLGLTDSEFVEARAGIAAGERIVVSGIETLADQTRVRVLGL